MEKDDKWKLYRPRYTIVLAISLIIAAAAGIIVTCWVEVYILPRYYSQNAYLSMFFVASLFAGGTISQLGLINLINLINNPSFNFIYIHLVFVASLIGSVICAIDVIGLFYMKKWAYYLGVTILVIYFICFRIITLFW